MPAVNTGSYFACDTNASITQCAVAASDSSYRLNNNFTISIWHAGSPGINKNIASMWRESSDERLWLLSNQTEGSLRLIFSSDGSGVTSNHKTSAVFDFSWKHIVVTFASGVFAVKINNVLQTLSATTPWGAGAVSLYAAATNVRAMLGGKNPNSPLPDDAAGGCYGDFSLWNKVLSSSEITELYNQGRPNTALHSAYVASCTNHWPLDQNDNTTTLRDAKNGSGSAMTITKTGANAVFDQSANYPKVEDPPAVGNVISGVPFDATSTGTFVAPTALENATAVMDAVVETGFSLKQSTRLMLAALAGKLSGAPGAAVTIRDVNDSKNRIVATVDANGNRTAVTKDVS